MSAATQPPEGVDSFLPLRDAVTQPDALSDSMNAPLGGAAARRRPFGISLFWRTFLLLSLLLLGSSIGWYQMFRTLEYEPRVIDNARQIASLVNLSRAALVHSDAIARVSLIKTLAEQEKVRIAPREPGDKFDLFNQTELERRMSAEIVSRLGPGTVVASRVNNEPGLWVGFSIEGDSYWLLTERSRIGALLGGSAWLLWLASLGAVSLVGAALLARVINRPLRQLSIAAGRVREGDYLQGRLDESARSSEIREVNIGFNRMADQLSKIEQDRAEMLAGISHDLRTPLARLRLEVEMSVSDEEAQKYMAADIEQVDSIINKFMDYARPDSMQLTTVQLAEVVQTSAYPYLNAEDMRLNVQVPGNLRVKADEVELARVVSNLLENARRYGKSKDAAYSEVEVVARAESGYVLLQIFDRGSGVPEAILHRLTQPFYRADEARTSAAGSGLGLSIVKKVVEYMGGTLMLSNRKEGGLQADLRLPRVK